MIAAPTNITIWVGFVSAVLLTAFGLAYLAVLVTSFIKAGLAFPPPAPVQLGGAIIVLFSSVGLIFLMAAVREQVAGEKKFFVELSLIFMALLCVTTCANRFVQLAVVPAYLPSDHPELGWLIHPYGPHSIMFAFESLGWGLFYGLGALCAAFAFGGSGLAQWIGGLFLTGGGLSFLFAVGYLTRNRVLSMLGFPAWGVLLTLTTALLAVWFWNLPA